MTRRGGTARGVCARCTSTHLSSRATLKESTIPAAERRVPDRDGITSFLGRKVRGAAWTLPRTLRAVAVMGGVELDLTEARLVAGGSEIDAVAVMGMVTVPIPPAVRVEYRGDPISIIDQRRRLLPGDNTAPTHTIWITARTFWGKVEVQLVDSEEG